MGIRVISWCLFFSPLHIGRLSEYLVGLRYNRRAARLWFPGWECRLYYDEKSLEKYPEILNYVKKVCNMGYPEIKMIPCEKGYLVTSERYRPFFEENVEVSIVRDIDGVLSKIDADFVIDWLNNSNCKVLAYKEYKMAENYFMGGGTSVKGSFNKNLDKGRENEGFRLAKGPDEKWLGKFILKNVEISDILIVPVRMSSRGTYHTWVTKDSASTDILWPVPFYDALGGLSCNYSDDHTYLRKEKHVKRIVNYSYNHLLRTEIIGSHWLHNKDKIIKMDNGWHR